MKAGAILIVLGACLLGAFPVRAEAAKGELPLQAAHAKAATSCHNCHGEERPSSGAGVTSEACMACHGDLVEVAELTKHLPVNPHAQPPAPHPGPAACQDCHKQHLPPTVTCLKCHPTFKFNAK